MKLPRKRDILAWHRWMGIISALFLVVLSITGLMLNHTERLGLNQITIHNEFILKRYGMSATRDLSAYRIQESDTLAHLDGLLFYNGKALCQSGKPLAIFESGQMTTVVTQSGLIYLSLSGELIERIDKSQLPYESLQAAGKSPNGKVVLVAETGMWTPDEDWINLDTYSGSYKVAPLSGIDLSDEEDAAILNEFQGNGVTLYRVLLDLHSGRLFGWGGRTLMDLTAIAILLLVTSGLSGWLRKSKRDALSN